jgi:hypothetical protein
MTGGSILHRGYELATTTDKVAATKLAAGLAHTIIWREKLVDEVPTLISETDIDWLLAASQLTERSAKRTPLNPIEASMLADIFVAGVACAKCTKTSRI